jgi:hypothetical protein
MILSFDISPVKSSMHSSFLPGVHVPPIWVEVFWDVTPWSDVIGYQHFGGPCCLHLQVVTSCSDVIGYQRFGGSRCLHLQVVTTCSDVIGYQHFGGPRCLHLQGENGGNKALRNSGILPHHYTVSQPRRPRSYSSPPWKLHISHVPPPSSSFMQSP